MTLNNTIKLLILLISLYGLFPFIVFGQDKQEILNLQADHITYDYKKGTINYEGNVYANQGQTVLNANQMLVYYNQKHKIEKVIATGRLAHYKTLINEDKDVLQAAAESITYYPILGKVILERQAEVQYNNSIFSGPYIHYDMIKKVISSHPQKTSRSKIVLEPLKQLQELK